MKIIIAGSVIVFLFACNNQQTDQTENKPADSNFADTTVVKAVEHDKELITPGKSIGKLEIGLPTDSAIAWLGQPDSSDAAMGSALMSWYSKDNNKYRTSIFAGRNMGNDETSRIKRIMVSAPWYKTADGIAPGTSLADIEKVYKLKQVDDATAKSKGLLVYDDVARGIIFDIDSVSKACKAITIYKAGEGGGTYINMH